MGPRVGAAPVPVLVLCLCVVGAASAAVDGAREIGRFDDRIRRLDGATIGVAARPVAELPAADALRAVWEAFARRHGGWKVNLDERTGLPARAAGRGIPWLDEQAAERASLADLEARARAFLREQPGLLGDRVDTIVLDPAASGRLQKDHWQLVFRQVVDGVRVDGARLDLHVKRGRLVMFGATKWGQPTVRGVPTFDAERARAFLDGYLEASTAGFEQVGEPQLSILPVDPAAASVEPQPYGGARGHGLAHRLVWRFRFREPGALPLWVGEVDAHDGSIVAFYDGAHYEAVRGGVFPVSNDEICASGGCEVAGFPMPWADYTESGEAEGFADVDGNLSCVAPTSPFETNLAGPYVQIHDSCGALSELGSCAEGLDLGLKQGENCSVDPAASPGNSAAARTAYYHIDRAFDVARSYDPTNVWLQSQVTVNVNLGFTCNASWNGEINMYGAGNGCGNTGEQRGVLVHEWGHGYDHNDGGGADVPSEAYADVVAIFANRSSCMSRGWYNDGRTCTGYGDTCLTCTGIRDFDYTERQNNTPTTPTNFVVTCPSGPGGPCAKEPHCESYPISEAIFDLATRDLPAIGLDADSAWQVAERLWYLSRPGSGGDVYNCFRLNLAHSCFATHWMQRMLVADDDDGDLSNGTPHAAAIFSAFDRHDIACGAADDPENQNSSGCPSIAAPAVSVTQTPSGTEIGWDPVANASEYRVYRGDLGCDRQQLAIATVADPTTSWVDTAADADLPRGYRVEAFGANPACYGPVSSCEQTPLAARLQPYDHRLVEPGTPNGIPDPGETVQLPVTLFNSGFDASVGTTGTLRLVDSTQGRVLEADASWADIAASDTGESAAPYFELVVFETTGCGQLLELELEASASNATPARRSIRIPLGERERDFVNPATSPIPPETTTPVTSTIVVDQDHTIAELDVSLDLLHAQTTELIVELSSPEGTTVRLHDQSDPPGSGIHGRYDLELEPDGPGTLADFVGETTQGTWTLSIEDVGPLASGVLDDWTLHFTIDEGWDCQPQACGEPTPPTPVDGLVVELGTNGTDLELSWNAAGGVAGYHVLQSVQPAFEATVELTGSTAGAGSLTVVDGVSGTPELTFFQVRAVNACSQEGP